MLNKKNYIKPSKITKQPLKHPKFTGTAICNRMNTGGASPPRATITGGAWVHAPPLENQKNRGAWGGSLLCVFLNRR